MPRHKAHPTICPYLTAKPDNKEKRFIQVGNTLLLNREYSRLGTGAQHLYLYMAMEAGGRNDFQFPQSAAIKYGISPASFWRYVKELEKRHFITVTSYKNLRQPNDYRFCLDWKPTPPKSILTDGHM